MKNEGLTAYDRFIISKKGSATMGDPVGTENHKPEERPVISKGYASYIENELRRTQPSGAKVLTADEFEEREREESERSVSASGGTGEVVRRDNVRFKKFGKVLLIAYVIIMLALALIVVVKTTVGENVHTADAAEQNVVNASSEIKAMDVSEDDTDNDDWFDHLCDSLK